MSDFKVEVLNKLIEAASENGADAGGSYNQAMDKLHDAIQSAMYEFNLIGNYEIIDTGNKGCYSPYRIVAKE